MYWLYEKHTKKGVVYFSHVKKISIFGRKRGIIPTVLRKLAQSTQSRKVIGQLPGWSLDAQAIIRILNLSGQCLMVIEPTPAGNQPNIYELVHVSGHFESRTTTILIELKKIVPDRDKNGIDYRRFTAKSHPDDSPHFLFLNINGSIKGKRATGDWNILDSQSPCLPIFGAESKRFFVGALKGRLKIDRHEVY